MLVKALFTANTAPPYGVPMWEPHDPAPIDAIAGGLSVRLYPALVTTHESFEIDERGRETEGEDYTHFISLTAEVAQECPETGPTTEHLKAAEPAVEKLIGLTCAHLRSVTGYTRVDVHARTLKFLEYVDELGNEVGRFGLHIHFPHGEVLGPEAAIPDHPEDKPCGASRSPVL